VRPGQAGELGAEESDEVPQGPVQRSAPGKEQPSAQVEAQGGPAGKQGFNTRLDKVLCSLL